MAEENSPRTLFVGRLDAAVTEELLYSLFANIGSVKLTKVIRDQVGDPYAFVEFYAHADALAALNAMDGRLFLDKEMKVNWAVTSRSQPKPDTRDHHPVFVGDLSPELESAALKVAFEPFGDISDCRIVRNPRTLESKGYGFVTFVAKADAENAINTMNGQLLEGRNIRTNWSVRKLQPSRAVIGNNYRGAQHTYETVYNRSSPTNCTVYCGGIGVGLTEDLMELVFSPYGKIVNLRAFRDKGYAFIQFATKESAAFAIKAMHGVDINGQRVNCSWGKELTDQNDEYRRNYGMGMDYRQAANFGGSAEYGQYSYRMASNGNAYVINNGTGYAAKGQYLPGMYSMQYRSQ